MNTVELNFEFNSTLSCLLEIYMQSPFEVPKKIETFFINDTQYSDIEIDIPVKSRLSDLQAYYKIYTNCVKLRALFPTHLSINQTKEYSYFLAKSSILSAKFREGVMRKTLSSENILFIGF